MKKAYVVESKMLSLFFTSRAAAEKYLDIGITTSEDYIELREICLFEEDDFINLKDILA